MPHFKITSSWLQVIMWWSICAWMTVQRFSILLFQWILVPWSHFFTVAWLHSHHFHCPFLYIYIRWSADELLFFIKKPFVAAFWSGALLFLVTIGGKLSFKGHFREQDCPNGTLEFARCGSGQKSTPVRRLTWGFKGWPIFPEEEVIVVRVTICPVFFPGTCPLL